MDDQPQQINNLRYGYIRQGIGNNGISDQAFVSLRGLDLPVSDSRTTNVIVPVHNIVDDFSWSKGKHTFQFGGNWRLINNLRASNSSSFSDALTNAGFLPTTGFVNNGVSFDPGAFGFPAVADSFANSYDFPMPPYETNGEQVAPTISLQQRVAQPIGDGEIRFHAPRVLPVKLQFIVAEMPVDCGALRQIRSRLIALIHGDFRDETRQRANGRYDPGNLVLRPISRWDSPVRRTAASHTGDGITRTSRRGSR